MKKLDVASTGMPAHEDHGSSLGSQSGYLVRFRETDSHVKMVLILAFHSLIRLRTTIPLDDTLRGVAPWTLRLGWHSWSTSAAAWSTRALSGLRNPVLWDHPC